MHILPSSAQHICLQFLLADTCEGVHIHESWRLINESLQHSATELKGLNIQIKATTILLETAKLLKI